MNFTSLYDQGFARVAACTGVVAIADPQANADSLAEQAHRMAGRGAAVVAFPELSLTGCALDDLLLNQRLLDAALAALARFAEATAALTPLLVVGAPLRRGNRLHDCAVVVHRGRVLGVAPKSYPQNHGGAHEKRRFASGAGLRGDIDLGRLGRVPFGDDLHFRAADVEGLDVHVQVGEDLWAPVSPGTRAALAGASVIVTIAGSPVTVGKADERHLMCRSASARQASAHVYCAAGAGESTTDLAWDGQTMIYENGVLLAEGERFADGPRASVADIDLRLLAGERLRNGSLDDNARDLARAGLDTKGEVIDVVLDPPRTDLGLAREVERFPFVPADPARLARDCSETFAIQVAALRQRLAAIGNPRIVLGVSGGLDSTLALLVAARVMDLSGRPRTDICTVTMPGFATSGHTRDNATRLARAVGATFETLDIRPAATQMLHDLGHPDDVYDVTFENVQAGLRADYLFRIANQRGGIVLGTGDMSELALGWCTYGVGDQMSHYAVNAGVPKTLMQHMVRWIIASGEFPDEVGTVLQSILDTEISPELIPAGEGTAPQSTQDTIGPYALHDFTLHHWLRHGFGPSRIAFLAQHAWGDAQAGDWPAGLPDDERVSYSLGEITHWLGVFCRRFMQSQFKRTASPSGPRVLPTGSLSPRGDWNAPSDANARAWLADLDTIPQG